MKKSEFEEELSLVDTLMQQELKKNEKKLIVKRLEKMMKRVEKFAAKGEISKETVLRIRADLCHLTKQVKKNDMDKKSSRRRLHDLVEHIFQMYRSRPKSERAASSEAKLMALLFRSFK